jgi:short-subunit dehydrogenase
VTAGFRLTRSMEQLRRANALLTGAAGGIGRHIAMALAAEGVNLVLTGRRREPLDELAAEIGASGPRAKVVTADLGELEQAGSLVEEAEAAIGPLDLLVNNAGVESPAAYPAFTDAELDSIVRINLLAPMVLARRVLPGMLHRGHGHVVTLSSLAGKGGTAYDVPYGTTKAGLVGLMRSLRVELVGTPVGASVVCPSFVAGEGMYGRLEDLGLKAPLPLRPVAPDRVASAVVRVIREDRGEVIVAARPMRPLFVLQELAPRVAERITLATGARDFFAKVAEREGRAE